MRPVEHDGCPANTLDVKYLSTAAIPLLLLLGSGPSLGSDLATPTLSAGAPALAQDDVPESEAAPPVEVAAEAGEQDGAEDQEASPEVEPPADIAPEPTLPDEALAPDEPKPSIDGFVNVRTRSRWADDYDEDDHDVYGVTGVDIITGGADSWGAHLLLRGSWGLDSQAPGSVFYGVQDTYTDQMDVRVYRAYVDAPVGDGLELARLGRMAIYNTPATAYFDGAQLETEATGPTRLVLGAYGGSSVHLSEGWPSDQFMGGLYARLRPWKDGQLRFDWMRLNDDDRYGIGENDLVSAGLTHRVGKDLRLEGEFSLLDGKGNDARLKGFWLWPEQDMTVRLSYYRLLEAQRNLAYELNPYYNILNTYFPYDQSQLVISKAFGERLELYAGLDTRRVEEEGDIGRFNRDFDRYYVTAAFPELLPMDTTLSITGDAWESPGDDAETWGLDLTSQVSEDMKVSLGSYYSLYKYYFDVNTEREDVRTFYTELRRSVSEETKLMLRYEFEDEEVDSFHSLWLGVTWRF